jgi:LysM domain
MIIHFGVDGTGERDRDKYDADMKNSYVHRMVNYFQAAGPSRYLRGPTLYGSEVPAESIVAVQYVLSNRPADGRCGIFLSGHSRGGVAVIDAARRLGEMGVDVDCLVLFDAVNRTSMVWLSHIPSNVKRVIYPRRDPRALSRPEFGNCGKMWNPLTTDYETSFFYTTHAGVGGTPWPVPPGASEHDLVWEPAGPVKKPTNVTHVQDRAGAQLVWTWTWPRVQRAFYEVTGERFPEPGLPDLRPDRLYTIRRGDTLSLLAQRYYGDMMKWKKIYDANNDVIKNPNLIYPNQVIKIPA